MSGDLAWEVMHPEDNPWPELYSALQNGTVKRSLVRGMEVIQDKKYLVVDLPGGIKGIIPPGEVYPGEEGDPANMIGKPVHYKVMAIDRMAELTVLSRRKACEELAPQMWERIQTGQTVAATVIKIGKRLAMLEVDGILALLPYAELGHGYIPDPHQVLTAGQSLKVKVIRLERQSRRLVVSLKALVPDPWLGVPFRYTRGGHYLGIVRQVMERGLFVEVEPGVMVRTRHHKYLRPRAGETVLVRIAAVDLKRKLMWGFIEPVHGS